MALNKSLLVGLGVVFTVFNLIRGIVTIDQPAQTSPVIVAMILYLATSCASLFYPRGKPIPVTLATVNLVVAVIVPLLVTSQLDGKSDVGYASWHVASISVLMVICIVRGRELFGWGGIIYLIIQTMLWTGFENAAGAGVTGALLWAILASAITRGIARITTEGRKLQEAEQQASHWQAAQDAHDRERSTRLERTTEIAMPMLRNIILTGGHLDDASRQNASRIEAGLRDDIRGRILVDDTVRTAVDGARKRGISVSLLDEGTLDSFSEASMVLIRERIAEIVDCAQSDCLIFRTAHGDEGPAVTVVGITTPQFNDGSELDDVEGDVDMMAEITVTGELRYRRNPVD